jgi:hypothetical protein
MARGKRSLQPGIVASVWMPVFSAICWTHLISFLIDLSMRCTWTRKEPCR